jgi:hypothetical protein
MGKVSDLSRRRRSFPSFEAVLCFFGIVRKKNNQNQKKKRQTNLRAKAKREEGGEPS